MERLPEVTPSFGLKDVEARTIRTREILTSSSSAAICASAVTMPWPISTFPGETDTWPCREKATQEESFGFALRLGANAGGVGGWVLMARAFRLPRATPPAPCDYVSRSGTNCDRARS